MSEDSRSAAEVGKEAAPSNRLPELDALRGLAIVLMIIDHVLVVAIAAGATHWLVLIRLTLTRLALPMFMVVSGFLVGQKGHVSWRRVPTIAISALFLNILLLASPAGFAVPEILLVWLMAVPFSRKIARYPVESAILGVLQFVVWPIPWTGYQPGEVIAFLALGVIVSRQPASADSAAAEPPPAPPLGAVVLRAGRRLPTSFETIGRHPLLIYVTTTVILAVGGGLLVRGLS